MILALGAIIDAEPCVQNFGQCHHTILQDDLEDFWNGPRGYHHTAPWWDRLPPSVQRGATFTLVSFAWLPFLFDMQQINQVLRSFAVWTPQSQLLIEAWGSLAAAARVYAVADADRIVDWLRKRTSHQVVGGIVASVAAVSYHLFLDRTATFIYFRF